jgi:CRP-like cAMP-binding protein
MSQSSYARPTLERRGHHVPYLAGQVADEPGSNPLAAKLGRFVRLSAEDKAVLDDLAQTRVRQATRREDIIREGDPPRSLRLFLDGWACRSKILADGRRQIVSFLLPGDLCDLNVFVLREMDHTISTLTPVSYAEVSYDAVNAITSKYPRITQALLWDTLVGSAIAREWVLNIGQRSALERVSHLFCELYIRLRAVNRTRNGQMRMPLPQSDIAEATGLSVVHVNRTLMELRRRELILLRSGELTVPDFRALREVAGFNPNYLHLNGEGSHLDANAQ